MADTTRVQVRAEMPGIIIHLAVEPGAAVSQDDELLVMESMKMEIPVHAPRAGVVLQFQVAVGDRVSEGDPLVVLEA